MIVKMKKLTLLVAEKDRESMLKKLRTLGLVHIRNVIEPATEETLSVEQKVSSVKEALLALTEYKMTGPARQDRLPEEVITEKVGEITAAYNEREGCFNRLRELSAKIEWYKPWGGFNPQEIEALAQQGVFIRLYSAQKSALNKMESKKFHLIGEDKYYAYVALATTEPDEHLPFNQAKLPKESLEKLSLKKQECQMRIDEIGLQLEEATALKGILEEHLSWLKQKQTFLDAMHGMKSEERFAYLQGFCPADSVEPVAALSKKSGCGYLFEDPTEVEDVPTLVRNPKWIGIIKPVFRFMNTVPGYREHDISLWFLIFFSIFFAMLIGDAGYGLLFIGLTLWGQRKTRSMGQQVPAKVFHLLYLLSFTTVVWGAITGTWFGAEGIAQIPFFNSLVIDNIDSFVDANQSFMIYICFIIGVVHLSIAHIILAVRVINSPKALSEAGWVLLLLGLFFVAGTLVLNRPMPWFTQHLLLGGISLVLLFANFQKNIIRGIIVTLTRLPLSVIGSFSDVVSYLRLFAVGYASVAVANSFNNMALGLGFHTIISGLLAAFILVFGHALNIILGIMAVIVHGIRLNMLEFSGQMGMEWSGVEYAPFRERDTDNI